MQLQRLGGLGLMALCLMVGCQDRAPELKRVAPSPAGTETSGAPAESVPESPGDEAAGAEGAGEEMSPSVAPVANGLYRVGAAGEGPLVRCQGGGEQPQGARFEVTPEAVVVRAVNNDNTLFHVTVDVPWAEDHAALRWLMVVGEHVLCLESLGGSQQRTTHLTFPISGAAVAAEVASHWGTQVQARQAPRSPLLVTFSPGKAAYKPKEEVKVTLRIENGGTEAVTFMKGGRNRGERDNQFEFSATLDGEPVEDVGSSMNFGGTGMLQTIAPGGVFTDEVSLSKWFAFAKKGRYVVHGRYVLEHYERGAKRGGAVWEEWVAADFEVVVR